ncbi:hypothetical protein M5D96_010357 [Drosophila gunungcola]|uniref:Acyl-coenzyme A oxidase n=1 Tax=Drosophila gunungcola TaxID=103775 RepID=A0A9Q0BM89_9MUSC|nr:hypothetical protein M5D96_010357 [Drosophila gunungcola]
MATSVIPTSVNPDLQKERDGASFSSEEFAAFWAGSEETLKFIRGVRAYMQQDVDVLEMLQLQNKSHEEIVEFSVKGGIEVAKKLRRLQEERNPGGDDYWPKLYDHQVMWGLVPGGNPFGVMYVMLVKALQAQCTPEQYEDFGKRLERFEICGTYAQTELGHGTYLRGLETRADFDPKTDEFLYIDNKSKGPHMFFIQVRDEETHEPLPGVHIGDIGKKLGFWGVNNGFLGLKNVRIPRTRMLMRHAQVNADGSYVSSPTNLFPEIATSLAHWLASDYLWNLYDVTIEDIEHGKYERLPELHSLSCALKVTCSMDSAAGVERLRLACGGHGYLISSNMSNIYHAPYEGENTVLLLQIGRFLMKTWRSALSGAPLAPTVRYLAEVQKNPEFGKWTGSWENMVKAMQYAAAKHAWPLRAFPTGCLEARTEGNAANHTGIEFTQAAELHGRAFVFGSFTAEVTGPKSKTRSAALNRVLENLLELYLVKETLNQMGHLLRDRLETVLTKLRPDAVAIVDGFDFSDLQLNSTLGSYDGNAYERIFDAALKNPMNQKSVPKSFNELLKPFMKSNILFLNPDLQKERTGAEFDVEEFSAWWQGGRDKLKTKREIEKAIFSDLEEGYGLNHEYMSHEEVYNSSVKQVAEAATKLKALQNKLNPGGNDIWPGVLFNVQSHGLFPANHPVATHITMFVDVIKGQGTPEQVEKWGKAAENCNIIGTYAQTELAHGTNVLGHTANHAMVVAQLYIADVHHGVQMFIVPVRDAETHMPLPGIDIGEVGKKLGMVSVNQGFLGLNQVERDGTFKASPASRLNYLTMVYTRCLIVNLNSTLLLEAATIATRYSAVRRQSPIEPNQPEPQIMDHVTQRLKLFPEIASGMAYHLAAEYMWEIYAQTVLCTTDGCAGIERLRLSTGGHGYLTAANLSNIYGNAVAAYTYEGENTVLLLQIGRALVKAWASFVEKKPVSASYSYFATSMQKTRIAFENLADRMASGQSQGVAANNTGIELVRAAELHGRQFVCQTFLEQITGAKAQKRSPALNKVLENVLELFLVQTVLNNLNDILRFINLSDADLRSLQKRLEISLEKFRPNAVAICDGFGFHDRVLNSVLGSYDGNVYPRLFDSAKRSTMNQKPVQKSFETYLKPLMKANL